MRRMPGTTAGVGWQYVGVVLRQNGVVLLSTIASCPYTQLLPVSETPGAQPNAWPNATANCTFNFLPPFGSAFGGINATLLGEGSPNKNFELQANVTYGTLAGAQPPLTSNSVTFVFDTPTVTTPTGSLTGVSCWGGREGCGTGHWDVV